MSPAQRLPWPGARVGVRGADAARRTSRGGPGGGRVLTPWSSGSARSPDLALDGVSSPARGHCPFLFPQKLRPPPHFSFSSRKLRSP